MLKVRFDCRNIYSLAMQQSGIPLIDELVLFNESTDPIKDLNIELSFSGNICAPIRVHCGTVHGGDSFFPLRADEVLTGNKARQIRARTLKYPLSAYEIQSLVDDDDIEVRCTFHSGGQEIHQEARSIRMLAYNTYRFPRKSPTGELVLDQDNVDRAEVYACFVTPNHPVVDQVLKGTSRRLEELGHANSTEGYQKRDRNRVKQLLQALYEYMGKLDINYSDPPASGWISGQKIRLPDYVLKNGLGTCADLAPFAASCMEQMGLSPVLVLVNGHVVQGAFLTEETAAGLDPVIDDVDHVRQLIEGRQLLLFDSSSYAKVPQPLFGDAIEIAEQCLQQFVLLVNVSAARMAGFHPFSIRMNIDEIDTGDAISLAKKILSDAADKIAKGVQPIPPPRTPLTTMTGARFKSWKDRLLDLSSTTGNRLLSLEKKAPTERVAHELAPIFGAVLNMFSTTHSEEAAHAAAEQKEEASDRLTALSRLLDDAAHKVSGLPNLLISKRFIASSQHSFLAYADGMREFLGNSVVNDVCQFIASNDNILHAVNSKIKDEISKHEEGSLYVQINEEFLENLEDLLSNDQPFILAPSRASVDQTGGVLTSMEDLQKGFLRVTSSLGNPWSVPPKWHYDLSKRLAREARSAEEETGFSPLYLALGCLQWRESEWQSEDGAEPILTPPVLAPLILYPIELKIDTREQVVTLVRTAGTPIGNVTLAEMLRTKYGIDLDILSELPEDDHGVDLEKVLRLVAKAIEGRPGWHVIRSAVVSQFSFQKFLLWRDLHDHEKMLLQSDAVRLIASAGRDVLKDPITDRSELNLDQLAGKDLSLVLPADSSQMAAVRAAMLGRSFVLQGPPGTGKSQTITNIIASAMVAGKTVLFVAEKQGALDVVFSRLAETGLAPFCLQLDASASNSKQVVASLGEALHHRSRGPDQWEQHCRELDRLHQQLARHNEALHRKREIGYSLYEMLDARLQTQAAVELPSNLNLGSLQAEEFQQNLEQINALCQQRDFQDDLDANPWQFTRLPSFTLDVQFELETLLPSCKQALVCLAEQLQQLQEHGLSEADLTWELAESINTILQRHPEQRVPLVVSEPQRWHPFRQQAEQWLDKTSTAAELHTKLLKSWDHSFIEKDITQLVQQLEDVVRSFILVRWIRGYFLRRQLKTASRTDMRTRSLRQILDDLRGIKALQEDAVSHQIERQQLIDQLPSWDGDEKNLKTVVQSWGAIADLAEEDSRYQPLLRQLPSLPQQVCTQFVEAFCNANQHFTRIAQTLESQSLPLNEHRRVPLEDLSDWLQSLNDNLGQLQGWASWIRAESEFRSGELAPLLDWAQDNNVPWDQLEDAYQTGVLQHWFQRCFNAEPELTNFLSEAHERIQINFRTMEDELFLLNRQRIQAKVSTAIPHGTISLTGSELTTLNVELNKQNRWLPLRTLFRRLPNLLPKLKPCILASPSSVARYLPADGHRFDIVIFDEASQMETHSAIGAMGRGKQVIVVGDDKQLPPSSTIRKKTSLDSPVIPGRPYADRLPSILAEAIAYGLPEQMLRWHYRSKHESLIEFSNQYYYASKLYLFPAPRRFEPNVGLHFHPVPNGRLRKEPRYSNRVNRVEAVALVDYLVSQLRRYEPGNHAHPSFGVVTFNKDQKTLIEALLDEEGSRDHSLIPWRKTPKHGDPNQSRVCFVKNLEEVQGDERDVMLFSTTFAPTDDGRFEIKFGLLNELGGERRLNVAITRARKALHIFSSMNPEDIKYKGNNTKPLSEGTRDLRDFLSFCKSRHERAHRPVRTNDFDGELQRQIYEVLTEAGYRVDCKIGSAGYRLDLAVVDPDDPLCYRIGIETDGQSYATAETVRDRVRVRYKALSDMGWKLHRVWSVAWLRNREREKQRLLEAVRRAVEAPRERPAAPPSTNPAPPTVDTAVPSLTSVSPTGGAPSRMVAASSSTPTPPPPPPPLQLTGRHLGRPYQAATLEPVSDDFSTYYREQAPALISARLLALLAVEAPITVADATRRVAACWGGRNLTKRAQNRLLECVRPLEQAQQLLLDPDDVLWLSQQQRDQWQGFRRPPQAGRSLDSVPPVEMRAALVTITRAALSIDADSLLREASKSLTGAPNFTEQRRRVLQEQLDQLLACGQLETRDGRIFAVEAG